MKKAFTLLELVFVIVVIGILAAAIIPRIYTNRIGEAAHQLVSHVRYTQHLAMSDDQYNSVDPQNDWYKNKWQIIFENTEKSNGEESYTIYSDFQGLSTGNANSKDEIAINPLNRSQRLTGGTDAIDVDEPEATPSMNLGETYGITEVKVTGGTASTAQNVWFDNMGRPYNIGSGSMNSPLAGLATSPIFIKLCTNGCSGDNNKSTNDDEAVIRINKETGYSCILEQNSDSVCLDI